MSRRTSPIFLLFRNSYYFTENTNIPANDGFTEINPVLELPVKAGLPGGILFRPKPVAQSTGVKWPGRKCCSKY